MNIVYDKDTLAAFRAGTTNSVLCRLVEQLFAKADAQGLSHYTCISVLTEGDTLSDLAALLGDDPREIIWTWITDHGAFIERGLMVGNDGFAHIMVAERGRGAGNLKSWRTGDLD